jgi:hypothetical protein
VGELGGDVRDDAGGHSCTMHILERAEGGPQRTAGPAAGQE